MQTSLLAIILSALLFNGQSPVARQPPGNRFTLGVTDGRKVVSREIGRGLLLRLVKERSVEREHFGWRLEVVRKPYRRRSRNLLYQNRVGSGADPSQFYAWHVAEQHFPDERELKVKGYPYTVRVACMSCRVEGRGAEAGFISGEIEVSWERRP
jgi:hypothetical protein